MDKWNIAWESASAIVDTIADETGTVLTVREQEIIAVQIHRVLLDKQSRDDDAEELTEERDG